MRNFFFLLCLLLSFVSNSFGQKKRINVYVDERMELLTVIQYLSNYPILNESENLDYKKQIESYFEKYKEHNAIKLFKIVSKKGFSFNKPIKFILNYQLPKFKAEKQSIDLGSYDYKKNIDTLNLFITEVKNFYNSTLFHKFYLNNKTFYKSLIDTVKTQIRNQSIIKILEEHYGIKNEAYNIILSPLMNDGGYSIDIEKKNGKELYAVVGPMYDSVDTKPKFDTKLILSDYVIHEFSHSFCNAIIDKYYPSLDIYSCLFEPIKFKMKKQGYGSWKQCLYEHLVRANEVILNEIIFGKQRSEEIYKDFVENGQWIYLKGMVSIVKERYLKQRDLYKTQEEIIPLIIEYLDIETINCH